MEEKENALLKFGSLCILIGGAAVNLISIFNGAATILAMSAMDENTLYSLSSYIMQESGGLFDSGDALMITRIVAIGVVVCAVVALLVNVIVGAMGLSRSKNPKKYKFFLGWGIALLIIGWFSMGELSSLRGICAAVGGIVGPFLYIIGGIQQNKAANADPADEQ